MKRRTRRYSQYENENASNTEHGKLINENTREHHENDKHADLPERVKMMQIHDNCMELSTAIEDKC